MARVLVVDDSTFARRKLKAILTQAGHEIVAEAANGINAFKEYERHKPDLVTMDVTMPVMDGVTAVKKIIDVFPEAKIIMVSALTQRNMVLAALESGAKHYIIKQSTDEKVMEVVDKVLSDTSEAKKRKEEPSGTHNSDPSREDSLKSISIKNNNGVFIIDVEDIKQDNLLQLNMVVRGLLTVKPLNVVFDFGKIEHLGDDMVDRLIATMENIKKSGGALKVVSNSGRIIQSIHDRNNTLLKSFFSEAADIE